MRARNIKPGFFLNEELSECKMESRLLFIGLWCYSDRRGRFKWSPKKIKASIFPYDNVDIDTCLSELLNQQLILKYEVSSVQYGSIPNFETHQRPHNNEVESIIPSFCESIVNENTTNDQPNYEKLSTLVESTFNLGEKSAQPNEKVLRSDSLITDILNTEISSSKKPDDGVEEFFQPKPTANESNPECSAKKKSNLSEPLSISFGIFWTEYPRKISKKSAESAWKRINPQNGTVEKILSALKEQKKTEQWQKNNGQFIPHPSTWLNQERWKDEITCSNTSEQTDWSYWENL